MRLSGVSAAPRRDRCGSAAPQAHGKSGTAAPAAYEVEMPRRAVPNSLWTAENGPGGATVTGVHMACARGLAGLGDDL
jgi:hypothetical protein